MRLAALQPDSAWAEDRATQRCDPSAVPGAKTDGAARGRPILHHRDWHQSDKPSQQDAAIASAGCPSKLANIDRPTFQFPLNQDNRLKLLKREMYGRAKLDLLSQRFLHPLR